MGKTVFSIDVSNKKETISTIREACKSFGIGQTVLETVQSLLTAASIGGRIHSQDDKIVSAVLVRPFVLDAQAFPNPETLIEDVEIATDHGSPTEGQWLLTAHKVFEICRNYAGDQGGTEAELEDEGSEDERSGAYESYENMLFLQNVLNAFPILTNETLLVNCSEN